MDVTAWLLDSDPAIRWQVLRDVLDAPPDEVAAERSRVATEGWGARLLAEQADDGLWDGGTYRPGWADERRPFFDAWTATHFSLQQLTELGLDPSAPQARRAVDLVRAHVRWEHAGEPYFDGETEPCINGVALAVAAYFGQRGDRIADTLVGSRLHDGGWNCWAESGAAVSSFHSTVCTVEGLLAWEHAGGSSDAVADARRTGEEYLLERGLYRRLSDGTVADPRMTMLSFPVRWFHDVLRGLDHFRVADRRDPRLADAVALVRSKADADGRWPLENVHEGPTLFGFGDTEGEPSRWLTLRALRVLRWWDAA
ncbi:hypothetical protein Cch01nite_23660 [Cellulomonas chitinilytica]|uniref:Squalene cyclase n=1 Tax=Cellulomonas chitinilytica TaxID=398759 RepID=A0A919P1N7_9CELL|nr:hypothetical protein [Cellulomonas chitinilytica]GIG21642.1 hypothetical protein Cch01nite_23660 [Cellulomonas chitinilytica]